jgi:glycosyl transferase family 2
LYLGFELVAFAFWILPLILLSSIFYGYTRAKLCLKTSNNTKKMIIQITTIAENYNLVNTVISTIRSYNLSIHYEIWVISELSQPDKYKGADKVVEVPNTFKSIAKYKARALDFSSHVRKDLGIIDQDVKVLYLDDDALPSKKYIEQCFVGDYDVMEGIVEPKLNYGTRYSYVDNIRTLSCLSLCSIFQSHGHPVWVHGEGLCVKASIEQKVGWNFKVIASEDLVFGHRCATEKLKWGFIWESVYITSPWNFKDYFKQRKRWLWGNVDAILRLLTWKSTIRLVFFYAIGGAAIIVSIISILMDQMSMLSFSVSERVISVSSFITWLGIYGYIGYIVGDKKPKHILLSMALAWYTQLMNTLPIWFGLFFRRPKRFEVIEKEKRDNKVVKSE